MKRLLISNTLAASLICSSAVAVTPTTSDFNDTGDILERSKKYTDIEYDIMVQRAAQAAIYYMPAVAQVDFIKATVRAGGNYDTVNYVTEPFGSDKGFLTANDTTAYAWGSISLKDGPMIVEVPPMTDRVDYFGSFISAWHVPVIDVGSKGADEGKGGKYLFLPTEYQDMFGTAAELEAQGYIIVPKIDTHDFSFSFRPTLLNGATHAEAGEHAKGIKIYSLAEDVGGDIAPTEYIDMTEIPYDCLPYYNMTFIEDINDVVQNNPIREKDRAIYSMLQSIGIEKGEAFDPTPVQRKAALEGLEIAYAHMQNKFITEGETVAPLWVNNGEKMSEWSFWNFGPQAQMGFPFEDGDEILIDKRAATYFYVTFLPSQLGGATFYLTGLRDSDGNLLNGTDTYKLNVPADVPAKDFWSAIVYNMETKNFSRGVERVGASTKDLDDMVKNEDGSVDVYYAPTLDEVPEGYEANWVTTQSATNANDWFFLFRLYRPEAPDWFENWMLSDVVNISKP
ncbi:Outer membrane porin F precursor [Ruegeria sp. THAF57]|uniref:DUF1214 domain-containing protein n=1 Tax=Ruegeria sp. THAF57 TaxID=2744555 RepID=UPI0015DEE169|nr:DUF1214 domain-containing protein [Ruegeria sp. THAF57]CAD0186271.1 Outer membrane porin F precursor [Ruegeria sp. THAF57]